MAKSKNATALFEVIHTAKKPPKPSPTGGSIPAPKWWAKGGKSSDRPESAAQPTHGDAEDVEDDAPQPEPTAGTRRSWLAAARQKARQPQSEPEAMADEEPADEELSPVYITRIYPAEGAEPDAAEEGADTESMADGPVADEIAPHAVEPPKPRAAAKPAMSARPPAEPPADRPSWSERRAKVLAERSGSTDPTFDPTADVAPADLRGPRTRKWAAAEQDEAPPAPKAQKPQKVRRSAGPTPSAHKLEQDSAVAIDRSAGEVRFRLSFGGAIFAGAILLLVVVIAFLAGRQRPVSDSLADNPAGVTHDVQTHAPQATETSNGLMAAASTTPTAPAASATAEPLTPSATPAAEVVPPDPAPVPAEPAPRQVGMMYVVIQSYPDRETAVRAGEFLNRNGVPCTVIPGLSSFALRDWFSIVGLQPFARGDHRQPVQDYLRKVTALGPKFSTKVYNQFQPQMYTWRADSDTPRP